MSLPFSSALFWRALFLESVLSAYREEVAPERRAQAGDVAAPRPKKAAVDLLADVHDESVARANTKGR